MNRKSESKVGMVVIAFFAIALVIGMAWHMGDQADEIKRLKAAALKSLAIRGVDSTPIPDHALSVPDVNCLLWFERDSTATWFLRYYNAAGRLCRIPLPIGTEEIENIFLYSWSSSGDIVDSCPPSLFKRQRKDSVH